MKRRSLRTAVLALLPALMLGTSGQPAATAAQDPAPPSCGAPGVRHAYGDERDAVCASIDTAIRVLRGSKLTPRKVQLASRVRTRAGERSVSAQLSSRAVVGDGFDEITAVGSDGTAAALLFPARSLFDNSPANEDYVPELPNGILVAPELVAGGQGVGIAAPLPGPRPGPMLSTTNLSQIDSGCLTIDSDGDQADEKSDAYLRSCWRSYKPSQPDSSPTYKWRLFFATSSSHGGNFTHRIRHSHVSFDGNPDHLMDDWAPTSTIRPTAPTNTTVTLSASAGGVGVQASHSFVTYPDTHGPVSFGSTDDYLRFGWNGRKGCDGDPCEYFGVTGGVQYRLPEGSTLNAIFGVHIGWSV